jgi:hypothetical protein
VAIRGDEIFAAGARTKLYQNHGGRLGITWKKHYLVFESFSGKSPLILILIDL